MKNLMLYILMFILVFVFMVAGLKACDHETEQNEIKNLQWVEDANNGKPYTNYQEK